MSRSAVKIPAFNGVAVGQPAQSNLQVGPKFTYNCIYGRLLKNGALVTLANLATDVDEIRLEADGDVIRRITPALLQDYLESKSLNGLLVNGAAAAVASFAIPFADPSRRDVIGEEATQLGTVGIKQLLLVVVLKDPGAAPVYALSGTADITTDNPKGLSVYERWAVDSFDIINGVKPFNTLATEDDIFGHLLHSAVITHVKVSVDDRTVFDLDKAEIESLLKANRQGDLTANYFPFIMDFSRQATDRLFTATRDQNDPRKVLARVSDVTMEITATAAATIKSLRRTLRY